MLLPVSDNGYTQWLCSGVAAAAEDVWSAAVFETMPVPCHNCSAHLHMVQAHSLACTPLNLQNALHLLLSWAVLHSHIMGSTRLDELV